MQNSKKEYLPIGKAETQLLTTDDKIILASKEVRVAQMGQNKKPLKDALIYVFELIGLKELNYPDERQTRVLMEFISNKLSMYTPSDFIVAFEMAVAGEVDVDMKHFQKFDSLFLSNVMKAYKEHRNKIVTQHELKERDKQFRERTFTNEEIQASKESFYKTMIVEEYKSYVKTGSFTVPIYSARLVFKEMETRGLINITRKEKNDLMKLYTEKVRNERRNTNAFERSLLPTDFESLVKLNCCYHCIQDAFEKMKKENVTL